MRKASSNRITKLCMAICLGVVFLSGCGSENTKNETVIDNSTVQTQDNDKKTDVEEKESDTQNTESGEITTGTYPDGSSPSLSNVRLKFTVDGQEIIVRLYDNTAVDAFLERLPLDSLEFYDLSGIEKPIRQPDEPFSIGKEKTGYDPVAGEMVIYRPWGNFTFFYGDFRYSDELVPLGIIESGLDIIARKKADFNGVLEILE